MNYKDCAELLKKKDNILIVTHKNPDGDTMGSAAALCSALRRWDKTAFLYPNTEVTEKLLPYVKKYYAPADFSAEYVVAVDVAAEKLFAKGFGGKVDLCIDHHPTNEHYAEKTLLYEGRSSAGEIILDLIRAMLDKPSKEEADLLYIAVSTDTGCFQYSNTNSNTFRAASAILRYGADNAALNTKFFRKISVARMRLEGLMYSNMEFFRGGGVVINTITRDMMARVGATEDDMDDVAGLAGKAEGAVVSVTIREQQDGSSKVSVRTPKEVSSSEICAVFGGGGHAMAAGCKIDCPPEKAKRMILDVINEVWK
ncbi:MAG: DHH family phosphoesterase [Candidatus Limivicinus sp.]|jgi:phosphoesterase RecJ-like protein